MSATPNSAARPRSASIPHSTPLPGPRSPQVSTTRRPDRLGARSGRPPAHAPCGMTTILRPSTWYPASSRRCLVLVTTTSARAAVASRTYRWCAVGEESTVCSTMISGTRIRLSTSSTWSPSGPPKLAYRAVPPAFVRAVAHPRAVAVPSAHLRWIRACSAAPSHATAHAVGGSGRYRRKGVEPGRPRRIRTVAPPPRSAAVRATGSGQTDVGPEPWARSVSSRRNQRRLVRVLGLLRRPLLLQSFAWLLHVALLRRLVGHDGPSSQHQDGALGCWWDPAGTPAEAQPAPRPRADVVRRPRDQSNTDRATACRATVSAAGAAAQAPASGAWCTCAT